MKRGDGTLLARVTYSEGNMGDDRVRLSLGLYEARADRREFVGDRAS